MQRLGLRRIDKDDESKLARPLLSLMQDHNLDFHGTFRRLCFFKPSIASSDEGRKAFIESVLELSSEPNRLDPIRARSEWSDWLGKYATRIESERDHWDGEAADVDAAREKETKGANPRFVLRQWLLEEVIKKVETDTESGKHVLARVLEVSLVHLAPMDYVRTILILWLDGL